MTEDEMVRWHHQLDGHEFEPTLGVGVGQGSLVCYSPWGCKESEIIQMLSECSMLYLTNAEELVLLNCGIGEDS